MSDHKSKHDAKHAGDAKAQPKRPDQSSTREGAAQRLADGIESSPLALVAGGLALGAVAGALLPRSDRERSLLAPVGAKIGGALTAAVAAAREAGQSELDGLGLNRQTARDQARTLVDGLLKAASTAATAGAQAATGRTTGE